MPVVAGTKRGHADVSFDVSVDEESGVQIRAIASVTSDAADAIAMACAHTCSDSAMALVVAFRKLDPVALTSHAGAIVSMLADRDIWVRHIAMQLLCRLETAALTPHAGAIVTMLSDHAAGARHHSVRMAFRRLDRVALTLHAVSIVNMLADPDFLVRNDAAWALGKIELATLSVHTGAIAGMLAHADEEVRRATVTLFCKLGKVEPAMLTPHGDDLAGMLADSDSTVRYGALRLFASDAVRMLTLSALTLACYVLVEANNFDRNMVNVTLRNVKKMIMRLRWAPVRAFVNIYRVRPYAFFWYEYAGKRLCAPGGKWAVRDCAEFDAEFNKDLHGQ